MPRSGKIKTRENKARPHEPGFLFCARFLFSDCRTCLESMTNAGNNILDAQATWMGRCGMGENSAETKESGFRLSGKETAMTLVATFLAIAGLASDDPLIVIPCLAISWVVFGYICIQHPGKKLSRIGIFVVGSFVCICLGIRLYVHSRPHAETLQLLPPPPNIALLVKCDMAALILPPRNVSLS